MNEIENRYWYALYTNPRAEKKLSKFMDKFKIENYLPLLHVKKKWSDRFKFIDIPLFSSYIFVKMDFFSEKNKVLSLPGAHHFVYHLGQPCIIPEEDIQLIRIFVDNFSDTLKMKKEENLQKGKSVFIKYGPFAGHNAEVVKVNKNARVILKILALKQILSVDVKVDDLGLDEL